MLSGGTGTPKLLQGIQAIPSIDLTVIANTGDDWEFYGLHVSPDCDSVLFSLAGILDQHKTWGIAGDTFDLVDGLKTLLQDDVWFNLGDRDAAISLFRTFLLSKGKTLTEATQIISCRLGISATVLPMTNEPVQTIIQTEMGQMHLEEYWVRDHGDHEVQKVTFRGAAEARVIPAVKGAIEDADVLIIGPSNPISSIGPILEVGEMREIIMSCSARRVAVSPIVGVTPLSGPAGKFMKAMGYGTSPVEVARYSTGLIDEFFIDQTDSSFAKQVSQFAVPRLAPLIMQNLDAKIHLAQVVLRDNYS